MTTTLHGQIRALLPATALEIADRLRIQRPSVSNSLRYQRRLGLVKRGERLHRNTYRWELA